ncbi:MAG: hypothetical protein ACLSA0_02385 [Eisenbergiella massiliensis]
MEDIKLVNHDVEQYRRFYLRPLAEGADIDTWGVGHEKSPNSMHMTYMRHPLENAEDMEDFLDYPFPDYAHGNNSHQKKTGGGNQEEGSDCIGRYADHHLGDGLVSPRYGKSVLRYDGGGGNCGFPF